MLQIDDKTYWINDFNRYRTQIPKTQIIIGFSLRKDSNHIIRLQHKEFGKTKSWNTFTVCRNGLIYQHYDPKYHTDFIGVKEVDKKSISIVLENMGCLYKTPDNKYINWINEICDNDSVVEKNWYGCNYWEQIPEIQFLNTAKLCVDLCNKYNIPKKCIEFQLYHKDTIKYNGIVFIGNYIDSSSNTNPLFDNDNFNKLINEYENE